MLKEAFLVGRAVPSIVLGPGGDVAALATPGSAAAQGPAAAVTAAADARRPAGGVDVRVRAEDGRTIQRFHVVATDGRGMTYTGVDRFAPLPAGRYRLFVSAPGYEPVEREVVVTAHQTPATVHVTPRRLSAAERFLERATRAIRRH